VTSDAPFDSQERQFWRRWTKENLPQEASSKVLKTLELIEHYDNTDAQPLFVKRDGSKDPEAQLAVASTPAQKPRKILIFIMYETHRQIMKKVRIHIITCSFVRLIPKLHKALSLCGRKFVEYDGNISVGARSKAIAEFERSDDTRIMLLSNVGTTGLNLTMASVVIFLVRFIMTT
jgi:SNF2 family DNA or RNA helicase